MPNQISTSILVLSVFCVLSVSVAQAQDAQSAQGAENSKSASDILQKTLAVYQNAKSYRGDWTYVQQEQQEGAPVTKMSIEVRAKGPMKLLFQLRQVADKSIKAPIANREPAPEASIVLDGKFAWSENSTTKVFYKVPLPKNFVASPLMFFPQMGGTGGAQRGPDTKVGDRTVAVIFGTTRTGGLSRMEIDTTNYRIVRVASEEIVGVTKSISTLVMDKEVFDGDVPDSTFSYKPPKAFKEIPATSDALGIFGIAAPDKPEKGK